MNPLLRLFLFALLLAAAGGGYWMAKKPEFLSEESFPVKENKPFAVLVYACNQASWCERTLRSIFEQDYENFRVVFIDDASTDETFDLASDFIVENSQEGKAILIRNEQRLGFAASLSRAAGSCLDGEIAVPLEAKDWLAHPSVLSRLNEAFQNPDVWFVSGPGIEYPSYEKREASPVSFYADLISEKTSKGREHCRALVEPVVFLNASCSKR